MITSPNTVLANCLQDSIDLIRPRLEINKPSRVVFSVGTQINGHPHIGTYLVQAASFVLAREIRGKFGIPCEVMFGALDNAPYEVLTTPNGPYQITWGHAVGEDEIGRLIGTSYLSYFDRLKELTGVNYCWSTYMSQQASPSFRRVFLNSLEHQDALRWCVAPSGGNLRIRIPCPKCSFAEKYANHTTLLEATEDHATFSCLCHEHGPYQTTVTVKGGDYLDLNTLYRNVIKEAEFAQDKGTLAVMVKGGDWLYSTQPIDWALGALGLTSLQVPMRIFTPQVLTGSGAKLSKSLIRDGDISMSEVPDWLLDMGQFRTLMPDYYASVMVWLVQQFLSHPRHFYRSYTYQEVIRLVNQYEVAVL